MKRVVPTSQVLHLWAAQTQPDARNGKGSVFFRNRTRYSSGEHFPMATIHRDKRGELALVLMEAAQYSKTTGRHKSVMRSAARHLRQMYARHLGPVSFFQHRENMQRFAREIAEHLQKAQRALRVRTVEWRRETAAELDRDAHYYREFFDRRLAIPVWPQAEFDAALVRVRAIEHPDPVRDAKRFKAREQRQERARIAVQKVFDDHCQRVREYNQAFDRAVAAMPEAPSREQVAQHWRDTGTWAQLPSVHVDMPFPGYIERKTRRAFNKAGFTLPEVSRWQQRNGGYSFDCLLRLAGNEIVTSQGARIPLSHAEHIWLLIQCVMARGEPYQHNGHAEHAGQFRIDRIDVDGTLHAGCHTIKFDELERMARTLGLVTHA